MKNTVGDFSIHRVDYLQHLRFVETTYWLKYPGCRWIFSFGYRHLNKFLTRLVANLIETFFGAPILSRAHGQDIFMAFTLVFA